MREKAQLLGAHPQEQPMGCHEVKNMVDMIIV